MKNLNRRSLIKTAGTLTSAAVAATVTTPAAAAAPLRDAPPRSNAEKVRQIIRNTQNPSQCPAVYDTMSAQLCLDRGYPLVLLGVAQMGRSLFGFGNYGLMTIT